MEETKAQCAMCPVGETSAGLAVRLMLSSVQFSRSVMSDSLRPHEQQHARPPCPSPTPGVYPNPCPSNWSCLIMVQLISLRQ